MGTPRLSKPVDQMRNVHRTANFGGGDVHDEKQRRTCRSNETNSGAITVNAAANVAFNSPPETLLAISWEAGAFFLVEVAQHILFVQHPGLQALCTGESETMQVRPET